MRSHLPTKPETKTTGSLFRVNKLRPWSANVANAKAEADSHSRGSSITTSSPPKELQISGSPSTALCVGSHPPTCDEQARQRRNAPLDEEQTRRPATSAPHRLRLQGREGEHLYRGHASTQRASAPSDGASAIVGPETIGVPKSRKGELLPRGGRSTKRSSPALPRGWAWLTAVGEQRH